MAMRRNGLARQNMLQRADALRQLHIRADFIELDARQQGHVDDIAIVAVFQRVNDLLDDLQRQVLQGFSGVVADVGRVDDLVQADQGTVERRLLIPDIDGYAAQVPFD